MTKLPPTFTAKHVAQKTGKPMEQVYAGVSRWVKDKKVRRGKDGYQKVMTGNPVQQKEPVGKSKNAAA